MTGALGCLKGDAGLLRSDVGHGDTSLSWWESERPTFPPGKSSVGDRGWKRALILEPHATVAYWHDGALTVHDTTQGPSGTRDILARLFGIRPDQVRVIARHVGGGFGSKAAPRAHADAEGDTRPQAIAEPSTEGREDDRGQSERQHGDTCFEGGHSHDVLEPDDPEHRAPDESETHRGDDGGSHRELLVGEQLEVDERMGDRAFAYHQERHQRGPGGEQRAAR
ncbi:molybdopterin cofactor-binding domain-containing protein [Streptomyces sp. H27-H5]|uniref:molybdopterin cofactor-binding domain-containing protein n=1 Tax=Streptomyces sp. H27-H5 TaxID=2996460 RepID=UPI00226DD403|nr:molybdopterin cofactor-binding domain-containing protein [Streptomyces sp. H27-H5]MCY0958052.1 molybdopterin-dependent oxidoreductase [Streptomyces sp. H27-H5]